MGNQNWGRSYDLSELAGTGRCLPATSVIGQFRKVVAPAPASGSLRRGFTLLEVILAATLSVVLLAALYAALKLHLTFAQRGPEQVQRSQKARAIVHRIALDVRGVVQPPPAPKSNGSSTNTSNSTSGTTGSTSGSITGPTSGSTSGTTGSTTSGTPGSTSSSTATTGTSSDSTGSTSSSTTSTSAYRDAYGVLGGTDWLQIYTTDERADLDDAELSAMSGSIARVSNVVRVSYLTTVIMTRPDAYGRTQRLGLMRTVVAAVGAEQFDTLSSDSDLHATTDYLSDDVAMVQFQYWDDTTATWLDSWGVDAPIAPPRAIKVTVSLLPPDEFAQTQIGLGLSTWQPTYSLVIPISTWDPDAGLSSSEGM